MHTFAWLIGGGSAVLVAVMVVVIGRRILYPRIEERFKSYGE